MRMTPSMKAIVFTSLFTWSAVVNAEANSTFFVDTLAGNDHNSCLDAQNGETPKQTIRATAACLSAGDTLEIKPGRYEEAWDNFFPSGTSWANATLIKAQQALSVVVQPTTGGRAGDAVLFSHKQYIIVDGIIIDGLNVSKNGVRLNGTSHHIRIQNGEIRNAIHDNGVFIQDDETTFNEFLNLQIYGNGQPNSNQYHGMYIRGDDNVVDNCRVFENTGYGIHIYGRHMPTRNVVKNSSIYRNEQRGMILSNGSDNVAFNNLIYENQKSGIKISGGARHSKVINNTITKNNQFGIEINSGFNTLIQNNIITNNLHNSWNDLGTGTIFTTNLADRNPNFVDETINDFR